MAKPQPKIHDSETVFSVHRISESSSVSLEIDTLAVEEPLEIRLGFVAGNQLTIRAISITMRTPKNDFELAAGFLYTEGIISDRNQILAIKYCGKPGMPENTVRIDLHRDVEIDFQRLERNFYTTSSCGVCGKTSLDALATGAESIANRLLPKISTRVINRFPETLRRSQTVFDQTGGLHAAALFDVRGALVDLKEDIGRHNAVDKLVGNQFLAGELPLDDKVLFLSGRASFELLQKAVMAKIPIVCSIGAPSSLAVEAAKNFGVTLIGFVRENRCNVYSGIERLNYDSAD